MGLYYEIDNTLNLNMRSGAIKNQGYKYSDITSRIIGCAMEVHRFFGNGFQEDIYQRALEKEFHLADLTFIREFEMPVLYKGDQIGTRRVDFLIEEKISVEIKALLNLENVHITQGLNYLEAYNLEIGLLINFGAASLQFKRLVNKKYNLKNHVNQ